MEIDNKSMDILKTLYKRDLSQSEFNAMTGNTNFFQPNEILNFLLSNNLIHTNVDRKSDGEGGFITDEATRTYSISRRDKAIVEQDRKDETDKWIDRVSNIIP